MTIFILSVASPSANRPFFILSNNTRDSSMGLSLQGDWAILCPFSSSTFWWHTYAWPLEGKEKSSPLLYRTGVLSQTLLSLCISPPPDEVHSKVIQFLEVVRCMCDSVRCVAWVMAKSMNSSLYYMTCNLFKLTKPFHHLLDCSEVLLLFFLWICVIISQETNSIVCLQKG